MPNVPNRVLSDSPGGAAWNKARDASRSFVPGGSNNLLTAHTVHGVVHEGQQSSPNYIVPTEATASASVIQYKIGEIKQDHVECYQVGWSWNGTAWVTGINTTKILIAKPPKLRGSITSAVYDGVTVSYTYRVGDTTFTERDAYIAGQFVETQIILPRYLNGDITLLGNDVISATEPTGGTQVQVSGTHLTWQDLNVDGRAWARKFV